MLLNMSNSEPGWLLLRLSQEGSKAHHHQLNSVLVWVCIIIKAPQTELSSEPFSVCLSVGIISASTTVTTTTLIVLEDQSS